MNLLFEPRLLLVKLLWVHAYVVSHVLLDLGLALVAYGGEPCPDLSQLLFELLLLDAAWIHFQNHLLVTLLLR